MRHFFKVAIASSVFSLNLFGAGVNVVKKGVISINNPAFLDLDRSDDQAPYRLIVNSFQPFGSDEVQSIENISNSLSSTSNLEKVKWTSSVPWPNETFRVPSEVFNHRDYFTIAGGFLMMGKSDGFIALYDRSTGEIVRKLTKKKSGYWYHQVTWADINGDGRLDILTARANKPLLGGGKGEILWLEQPASPLTDDWAEHFIGKGPDVNFIYEDIDRDGSKEIIATEFFGEKLSLWWLEGNKWKSQTLDSKLGAGFDLQLVDLNNDGHLDLLATNHVKRGSVFAYEIPENIKSQRWNRITLLDNIQTKVRGMGQASPGRAIAFHPNADKKDQKPLIIVAGDGSQKAHLLTPNSEDSSDWGYKEDIILKVDKGVIGQIAVGDVDFDGNMELFIPAYDEDKIHIYSVK